MGGSHMGDHVSGNHVRGNSAVGRSSPPSRCTPTPVRLSVRSRSSRLFPATVICQPSICYARTIGQALLSAVRREGACPRAAQGVDRRGSVRFAL